MYFVVSPPPPPILLSFPSFVCFLLSSFLIQTPQIRTLLEANGVVDAMRRRRQETFLDHYDRETRGNESKAFFAVVLTRLKECSEYIAELTDTPQHRASQQSFVRQAVEGGLRALYAVLLASTDTNAALAHAKALNVDEAGALTSKVKRHVRTAAMNFTELNQAHPLLVKTDGTPYALPDGGTAACLFQLATPVFAALEACVRVVASVASGDTTAGAAAEEPDAAGPSASNAAFSPPNPVSPVCKKKQGASQSHPLPSPPPFFPHRSLQPSLLGSA